MAYLTVAFSLVIYFASFFFPPSQILNAIVLIFLLIYFFLLLKNENDFAIMTLFFIWTFSLVSIICFLSEFGGYFTEAKTVSFLTGATTRNVILSFLTIQFALFMFKFCHKLFPVKVINSDKLLYIESKIFVFLYLICIVILICFHLVYGHPSDYGSDRFSYWNHVAPRWGLYIKQFLEYSSVIVGFLYSMTRKKRYICLLLLALISMVGVGDKFSALIQSIFFFIIPFFLFSNKSITDFILNTKFLIILFIMLLCFLTLSYFSYFYIYGQADSAFQHLLDRILLQAQMWWCVDNFSDGLPKSLTIIWENFVGFGNLDYNRGISYLMSFILPQSLFDHMMDEQITTTMAYPANLLYFFGNIGAVIASLFEGYILGFGIYVLYFSIKSKECILMLLSIILYYLLIQIALMGNTFMLGAYKFWFAIVCFIIYFISFRKFFKVRS